MRKMVFAKKNKLSILFKIVAVVGFLFYLGSLGSSDVSAAYCAATNEGSNPAFIGQPCTACVLNYNSCPADQPYGCCTGVGIDNGKGGVHCDVSGDSGCTSAAPSPTPGSCSGITYDFSKSGPYNVNESVTLNISRAGANSCSGNWDYVGLLVDGKPVPLALCYADGSNCSNGYHATINTGSAGTHTVQFTVNNGSCDCNTVTFETRPLTCPLDVTMTCGNIGNDVYAEFSWNESPGADRYILRVNRNDGENPEWMSTNDHWYYVDDMVGTCDGTNCTARIDQSTPKKFVPGNYLGWSVQSYAGAMGSGYPGCEVYRPGFSCTMPQGRFNASCSESSLQSKDSLSYTFTVDNITGVSGPFNGATFYLSLRDDMPYASALRRYLGSPTWVKGNWQGYFLGSTIDLVSTSPAVVQYKWNTANSPLIGSNGRTVDELAQWMQDNYPDSKLTVGARIKFNNVENETVGEVQIDVDRYACYEPAGWGVDNVSVCWDGSLALGASDDATSVKNVGKVSLSPINKGSNSKSFVNKVLSVISKVL